MIKSTVISIDFASEIIIVYDEMEESIHGYTVPFSLAEELLDAENSTCEKTAKQRYAYSVVSESRKYYTGKDYLNGVCWMRDEEESESLIKIGYEEEDAPASSLKIALEAAVPAIRRRSGNAWGYILVKEATTGLRSQTTSTEYLGKDYKTASKAWDKAVDEAKAQLIKDGVVFREEGDLDFSYSEDLESGEGACRSRWTVYTENDYFEWHMSIMLMEVDFSIFEGGRTNPEWERFGLE